VPPLALVALVVGLLGCNAVFDIDSTEVRVEPPTSDNDGDGIVNVDDNCVLVANAEQADGDGDEIGDACDPCLEGDTQIGVDGDLDGIDDGCDSCLSGRNHDEDADGIGDDCDVCPGVPDLAQDGDSDGVGDACDRDSTAQRRAFFDGFGPPDAAWNTGFKPWEGTADGFTPSTPEIGNSTYNDGPWNANAVLTGPGIRVVASVIVPPPPDVLYVARLGLNTRQFTNGSPTATCRLESNQINWFVAGDSAMTPVPAGRTRFELSFKSSPTVAGYMSASCTIAGVTVEQPMILYEAAMQLTPSLVANVAAEFEWIDVLE
jgi:Thrombospondin type 3 repeat